MECTVVRRITSSVSSESVYKQARPVVDTEDLKGRDAWRWEKEGTRARCAGQCPQALIKRSLSHGPNPNQLRDYCA